MSPVGFEKKGGVHAMVEVRVVSGEIENTLKEVVEAAGSWEVVYLLRKILTQRAWSLFNPEEASKKVQEILNQLMPDFKEYNITVEVIKKKKQVGIILRIKGRKINKRRVKKVETYLITLGVHYYPDEGVFYLPPVTNPRTLRDLINTTLEILLGDFWGEHHYFSLMHDTIPVWSF